jgi:hypothetical protein
MKVQVKRHINEEPQVLKPAGGVRDGLRHLWPSATGPGRGAGRGQGSFGSPNVAVLGARDLQLESGGQVVGAEGLAGVRDCLGGDAPVDLGGPDAAVEGNGQ